MRPGAKEALQQSLLPSFLTTLALDAPQGGCEHQQWQRAERQMREPMPTMVIAEGFQIQSRCPSGGGLLQGPSPLPCELVALARARIGECSPSLSSKNRRYRVPELRTANSASRFVDALPHQRGRAPTGRRGTPAQRTLSLRRRSLDDVPEILARPPQRGVPLQSLP